MCQIVFEFIFYRFIRVFGLIVIIIIIMVLTIAVLLLLYVTVIIIDIGGNAQ